MNKTILHIFEKIVLVISDFFFYVFSTKIYTVSQAVWPGVNKEHCKMVMFVTYKKTQGKLNKKLNIMYLEDMFLQIY